MPTENPNEPLATDLLWGVDEIARFIGVPLRKAYYLIDAGKIPVTKHGHRTIVASRNELRRLFAPEAA
jgi:Helix-turn-helix domain